VTSWLLASPAGLAVLTLAACAVAAAAVMAAFRVLVFALALLAFLALGGDRAAAGRTGARRPV
jgi:hypothetical protein